MAKIRYNRRTSRRPNFRLVLLLITIIVGITATTYLYAHRAQQVATKDAAQPQKQIANAGELKGRYLLNGTVTWARAVEQQAGGNFKQPFSMLDSFHRDKYDAWSTDFECPITNNVVPYQTQINDLIFNCRPEFLPEAAKYFNIFDLANNHTDNQNGKQGLNETRKHLDEAGVQYFGTFDPGDYKDICEVVSLPVHVENPNKEPQKAALPVAFCGWHYFYHKPQPGEIEIMKQYASIMPVFAFAEMGVEYHAKADDTQVAIAHQIVDQGPEFLIANNPHWVQNTEVYKNTLIVYSTGNFIFDQLDSETNRSASIDLSIATAADQNVTKWLALAPECKTFHDSCLDKAKQQGLTKIKLNLKYDYVAGQNGYKVVTHKAPDDIQKAVGERLNWTQTLKQLNQ